MDGVGGTLLPQAVKGVSQNAVAFGSQRTKAIEHPRQTEVADDGCGFGEVKPLLFGGGWVLEFGAEPADVALLFFSSPHGVQGHIRWFSPALAETESRPAETLIHLTA